MRVSIGGVYQIVCKPTGQFYAGCTKSFTDRERLHFDQLRWGNHYNKKLQSAYNAHGRGAFAFCVIQNFGVVERWGEGVFEFNSDVYGDAANLERDIIRFNDKDRLFNTNGVRGLKRQKDGSRLQEAAAGAR